MDRKAYNLIILGEMVLVILLSTIVSRILTYVSHAAHLPEWVPLITLLICIIVFLMIAFEWNALKLGEKQLTIRDADTREFPRFDKQTFDHYEVQLANLGFEPRFFYSIQANETTNILTRLYYNPLHKCAATNSQMFIGNTVTSVVSVMSELDENWRLSNINLKPNAINCIWRSPRSLWNVTPASEPHELLDAHLNMRQRMIDGLGVCSVTKDEDQQAHFDLLIDNHRKHCEILRKKNFISLFFEYHLYRRKPIYLWMGEFEKVAKKRGGI